MTTKQQKWIEKKGQQFKGKYPTIKNRESLALAWLRETPKVRSVYYPWNPFWGEERLISELHRRVIHTELNDRGILNPDDDSRLYESGKLMNLINRRYKTLTGNHARIFTMDYEQHANKIVFMGVWGIIDGKPAKDRDYTVKDKPTVFMVMMTPYDPGRNGSHALTCVQYKDTVYFFNSHGTMALQDIDKKVLKFLKMLFPPSRKEKYLMYTGPDLQSNNYFGVCAGYGANFALEMLLLIRRGRISTINTQEKYNEWVSNTLQKRGICFGGKCVKCIDLKTQIAKNLVNKRTPNLMKLDEKEFKKYAKKVHGRAMNKEAFLKERNSNIASMLSPTSVVRQRGTSDKRPKGTHLLRSMFKEKFPNSNPTYIRKLKFWMTSVTPSGKRDFMKKIRDSKEFEKIYPTCAVK